MATWTPLAQDAASDLSSPAVKVRPGSPVPASSAHSSPSVSEPYPSLLESYPSYPESQYYDAPDSPESLEFYDSDSFSDDEEYQVFERNALITMAVENNGILLGKNPRVQTSNTADDSYREQQEQNNYTAKKSRDRRKLREFQLILQETYLKKKINDLRGKLEAGGVCVRCGQTCV